MAAGSTGKATPNVVRGQFARGQRTALKTRTGRELAKGARMARGNFPPLKALPAPPVKLSEDERAVWDATGRLMVEAQLLTAPLLVPLVDYARCVIQAERHAAVLAEEALVVTRPSGGQAQHPRVLMWSRAIKLSMALREQLGLVVRAQDAGTGDAGDEDVDDLSGAF